MKIDNLNPVAPGIAKIAAKRRLEFSLYLPVIFFRTSSICSSSRTMIPKWRMLAGCGFLDFKDGEELVFATYRRQ